MKAYVINLDRAPVRRARISAQLEALGMPFIIFPAIDGRNLDAASLARDYDEAGAREFYREMTRGEVACALSHLGVYRRILDAGADHALVLEDDARLGPSLPEVLDALETRLPADLPRVVLLTYVDKYTRWGSEPLPGKARLVRRYGEWWRAHGYVVTRAAAERMVAALHPVRTAADHWSGFDKRGIVDVRAVVPYCIGLSELAAESSLETMRAEKDTADKRASRGPGFYLYRYGYQRFLFQLFVRPLLRVARQRQRW